MGNRDHEDLGRGGGINGFPFNTSQGFSEIGGGYERDPVGGGVVEPQELP